jgi:predicted HTH domain antitoxin
MPDELFLSLGMNPEQLAEELRLAAAVKWYETGMLSQGKAAEVAGLSRATFIMSLARFSVSPFQETVKEILEAAGAE